MHLTKCETLLSCKNSLSEKLLKQNWYWLGNLRSEEVPQILNLCVFSFSRSDCVEILKKCGDQNKFPEDHTAESICELLSPTDDLENCIPLDTYLSKYFFFKFNGFSLLSLPLMFALHEHLSVENMWFNDNISSADSYLICLPFSAQERIVILKYVHRSNYYYQSEWVVNCCQSGIFSDESCVSILR